MKRNQNKNLNSLKLFQEPRIYTVQNIPNNRDEEIFPGFLRTAGSIMRRPNIGTYEKEKTLQSCQQKTDRRKLQGVKSDRVTNADIRKRKNMKEIVAVAHSLRWKWGGYVAGVEQHRRARTTSIETYN
jgi:hypothetical protein